MLTFSIQLDQSGVAKWLAMSQAARDTAGRVGVKAAAMLVENDAKIKAPFVTGTLRRSISTEIAQKGTIIWAYTGSRDVPYARRIEFGFVGSDSLGRTYNQAAQPYLRPALDGNKDAIVSEISAAVRDMIAVLDTSLRRR